MLSRIIGLFDELVLWLFWFVILVFCKEVKFKFEFVDELVTVVDVLDDDDELVDMIFVTLFVLLFVLVVIVVIVVLAIRELF